MKQDFNLPDDLIGLWWFDHDLEQGSPGLIMFLDDGRAIQYYTLEHEIPQRDIMLLWYDVDSTNTIQFRYKPVGKSWPRYVTKTQSGFIMSTDENKEFPMSKVCQTDLPEWFHETKRTSLKLMEKVEISYGV